MITKRDIELLKIERECVSRTCDRNCGACDLAQTEQELLAMYDRVIAHLQNLDDLDLEGECEYYEGFA